MNVRKLSVRAILLMVSLVLLAVGTPAQYRASIQGVVTAPVASVTTPR